jgi:hypothetical protein
MQIIYFGQKIGASWGGWGGNFPLDFPIPQEYFLIVVTPRSQINPTTKPLTFRGQNEKVGFSKNDSVKPLREAKNSLGGFLFIPNKSTFEFQVISIRSEADLRLTKVQS